MLFHLYRKSKYTLYDVLSILTFVDACISIFSFVFHKPICTHSLPLLSRLFSMFASTSISRILHLVEDVSRQLLFFEGLKFNLFPRVRACACACVCPVLARVFPCLYLCQSVCLRTQSCFYALFQNTRVT